MANPIAGLAWQTSGWGNNFDSVRTTALDGVTIEYEVSGDGPTIVLVHGITESRRSWDPLVPELARDHLVVCVDLRGHGESERRGPYDVLAMANDVFAVVNESAGADPLMIGHSLGAFVVSVYAGSHPARATVNIDQPLELSGFREFVGPWGSSLHGDEEAFSSAMSDLVEPLYGALPESERGRIESLSHPEQEVVLGLWDPVLAAGVDDLRTFSRDVAAGIRTPYLALHGSDPGHDYVAWLKALVPAATVEIWPGLGHYPHLVEPERFLRRIRLFRTTPVGVRGSIPTVSGPSTRDPASGHGVVVDAGDRGAVSSVAWVEQEHSQRLTNIVNRVFDKLPEVEVDAKGVAGRLESPVPGHP